MSHSPVVQTVHLNERADRRRRLETHALCPHVEGTRGVVRRKRLRCDGAVRHAFAVAPPKSCRNLETGAVARSRQEDVCRNDGIFDAGGLRAVRTVVLGRDVVEGVGRDRRWHCGMQIEISEGWVRGGRYSSGRVSTSKRPTAGYRQINKLLEKRHLQVLLASIHKTETVVPGRFGTTGSTTEVH